MDFTKLRQKVLVEVIIKKLSLINFDFADLLDCFFDEPFILIVA